MSDWEEMKRAAEESMPKCCGEFVPTGVEHFGQKEMMCCDAWQIDGEVVVNPFDILELLAENERLREWREEADGVLCSLACQLGAGGYNAEEVDPKVFGDKIRWGIDALVDPISRERDKLRAEVEALRKDADRYRFLRMADWWKSPVCAIANPKQQAKPGSDCPSRGRLDDAIDAAMSKGRKGDES
jgi:hypothetical protein